MEKNEVACPSVCKDWRFYAGLALLLSACGAPSGQVSDDHPQPMPSAGTAGTGSRSITTEDLDEMAKGTTAMSLDAFRARARKQVDGQQAYLVEGDMLLWTEEQLRSYYYEIYLPAHIDPTGKLLLQTVNFCAGSGCSLVWMTRGNIFSNGEDPLDIKYCYSAGWGSTVTDSYGTWTAPLLPAVQPLLEKAMNVWAAFAKVRFHHVTSLDGAACSTAGTNPGVSFVIAPHGQAGILYGPLPTNPWAEQILKVPPGGVGNIALALHELGHALGFRHENIRLNADPFCDETNVFTIPPLIPDEENVTYVALTDFDTRSIMKYVNCGGKNIDETKTTPSGMDGAGARKAYGNPRWWAAAPWL